MVKCKHCGSVDSYTTELKSNNYVAHCKECGMYMGNIPHSEITKVKKEWSFYFGKYNGTKLNDCNDRNYLLWLLKNMEKIKPEFREAINDRIDLLD